MTATGLVCVDCGAAHPLALVYECRNCGGILEVLHDEAYSPMSFNRQLVAPQVSLGEGCTPLLLARRSVAASAAFAGQIWLKDETKNPSGSFKDRLVSAALTRAMEFGVQGVVCASSGNAGASAAAYAARTGLPAVIVVPASTPPGKMTQITAYGALMVKVEGHYSNSYAMALRIARDMRFVNLTTTFINPFGTDALRRVGYELHANLNGAVPDWVVVPTGAGPLVKGVVQGFRDMKGAVPKIVAVQAEGCAPIVRAFEQNKEAVTSWGEPQTIASGISDPLIGYERDGTYTLKLVRESGGRALSVSDNEIRKAMQILARREGVFAEPTGASSFAAAVKMIDNGEIDPQASVVCMITGHGFKDPKVYKETTAHELNVPADAPTADIREALENLPDVKGES